MGHQIQEVKAKKYGFLLAEIERHTHIFLFLSYISLERQNNGLIFYWCGVFFKLQKSLNCKAMH